MDVKRFCLGAAVTMTLVACSPAPAPTPDAPRPAPADSSADRPAAPVAAAWPDGDRPVASPVDPDAPAPAAIQLLAGGTAEARSAPVESGRLNGVGVLVGTNHGIADGRLELELCQPERCVEAVADARTAVDNEYLAFVFDGGFDVSTGSPIVYRLTYDAGATAPVALWTYAAVEGSVVLQSPGAFADGRAIKVVLHYAE